MSTSSLHGSAERLACVACHGATELSETITADALVEAWRREDAAVGAADTLDARSQDLAATLPAVVRFHRCSACGLEMAQPAHVWSAKTYPRDQSYPVRWEFYRALDDLGPAPLDLLEIGCGTGRFLELAAARGHRALGIDFNDAAVGEAKARGARALHGGFDEVAQHVGQTARFDAVALFHVIEHLHAPDVLLAEIGQWVRPRAHLVISCPGPRRFTRLVTEQRAGRNEFWDYPPQHVLRWTLPALGAACARHGWRVVAALEEPFSWIAAGSHIGIARAQYRGTLRRAARRKLSIALGWWRLFRSPQSRHGVSIYLHAVRHEDAAA